ncbi:hypothetical protein AAVH_17389 [Aphelenchoides avenae]|nr:hypothetical protein AAVH_17389 [Aphelenchus avenae]
MNPESFLQVASARLEADVSSLLVSLSVRKSVLVGIKLDKAHAKVALLKSECETLDRRLEEAREKLEAVQSAATRMPQVAAILEFRRQRRGKRNCHLTEKALRDIAECVDNASVVLAGECISQSSKVRENAVEAVVLPL